MRLVFSLISLFMLLLSLPSIAGPLDIPRAKSQVEFSVEELASGLGIPWGLAFISPNELLISERDGTLKKLDLQTKEVTEISGIPKVMNKGQGGLMDVAVPPDFKPGDWIYFSYSKSVKGRGVTTLARARLKGHRLRLWQDLLVSQSASNTDRHYGSRITFDDQGHLFFGIGDRGDRPNSQNLGNHAGTVIRLNRDGSIPSDNPFFNSPEVLPEIWSYGHRNPQGISYDINHKRLWVIEHGPRGGDEINLVKPGANYGWPVISYGKEYWGPISVGESTEKKGMEQPLVVYVPSIAPSSLLLYSGKAFPQWRGNLFSGALKLRHLNRIELNTQGLPIAEERLLTRLNSRIRALTESPEGWIVLSTDSGRILRLRPRDLQ